MKNKFKLYIAIIFLALFIIWTIFVNFVDVLPIGPNDSKVGFATINNIVHNFFGINMTLYFITDWLGLVPIGIMLIFAIIGFVQWIKRKNLLKVDFDILLLGLFYILLFGIYLLFEYVVINYRPILIDGFLEASYPSSTTMLVICTMATTILQSITKIKNKTLKICFVSISVIFMCFMVFARLISGVHWVSDIIGGLLISSMLVALYDYIVGVKLITNNN